MIISRAPFRISLFGGSTDYESFYSQHGSFLIGFTLDQYCYTTTRRTPKILPYHTKVSYSRIEVVDDNRDIEHDGVRGVLTYLNLLDTPIEINHFSDLPSQTGTGSSSAFVVSLLKGLHTHMTPHELARASIKIEREILSEAGGIQDQIWAAYGGINSITINTDGSFLVRPLPISGDFRQSLIDHSFLIYTGKTRKSYRIASSHDNVDAVDIKKCILDTAHLAYDAFESHDVYAIGNLLHKSWEYKKSISNLITSNDVDKMYNSLLEYDMVGGKLLGSGGSGFIFGIAKDPKIKRFIESEFRDYFIDVGISYTGAEIL